MCWVIGVASPQFVESIVVAACGLLSAPSLGLGDSAHCCWCLARLLHDVFVVGGHIDCSWAGRELNERMCEVLGYLRVRLWVVGLSILALRDLFWLGVIAFFGGFLFCNLGIGGCLCGVF